MPWSLNYPIGVDPYHDFERLRQDTNVSSLNMSTMTDRPGTMMQVDFHQGATGATGPFDVTLNDIHLRWGVFEETGRRPTVNLLFPSYAECQTAVEVLSRDPLVLEVAAYESAHQGPARVEVSFALGHMRPEGEAARQLVEDHLERPSLQVAPTPPNNRVEFPMFEIVSNPILDLDSIRAQLPLSELMAHVRQGPLGPMPAIIPMSANPSINMDDIRQRRYSLIDRTDRRPVEPTRMIVKKIPRPQSRFDREPL